MLGGMAKKQTKPKKLRSPSLKINGKKVPIRARVARPFYRSLKSLVRAARAGQLPAGAILHEDAELNASLRMVHPKTGRWLYETANVDTFAKAAARELGLKIKVTFGPGDDGKPIPWP